MSALPTPDDYLVFLVGEGLADNTVRVYRSFVTRWCDWATTHDRDPHAPDPLAMREWSSCLPYSESTRYQARVALKHWCRLNGSIDTSGAIGAPRKNRAPRSRALTPEQARQLAETADGSGLKGLAVLVGLYTGARRSEIASLAWERIYLDEGYLVLDRPKVGDTHEVPLHPALARRLAARSGTGEQWVFPGRWGGHTTPAKVWEWVREVAAEAGVGRVTPHMLRHTIIGAIYDVAKDLRAAQEVAGHTDPAVTARYSSRTRQQIESALKQIDWLDPAGSADGFDSGTEP